MVFRTLYHRLNQKVFMEASLTTGLRQLAACTLIVSLSACSALDSQQDKGKIGSVKGYIGAVVADEPRAALIGRDVLSAGGTAADAVTAMYFASAVTMPSSASLGGGGVCVIHDRKDNKTEALDFLSKAPQSVPAGTVRPVGVPMNARGFFILQSKYGDLRWAQLISPAENLARFGTQVSRALAAELRPVGEALIRDNEAARVFAKEDGTPVHEGDFIKQYDLAATLTEIRTKGPGALYVGTFAKRFLESVKKAGGYLTAEDLRDALPQWRETVKGLPYNFSVAHFAPPAAAGGVVGAQIWSMLAENGDFASADETTRAHLLAEASMRAYGERARWVSPDGRAREDINALLTQDYIENLMQGMSMDRHQPANTLPNPPQVTPEAPSALSLVAIDSFGTGVACNVSMNSAFGVGRIAPQTGVLLSALPGLNGRGPMPLGPMLIVNENSNEVYFAGAASRGVTAPTQLVNIAARTFMAKQTMQEAMSQPRTHHGGAPDKVFYESNLDTNVVGKLQALGYELSGVEGGIGIVNAIVCPGGLHAEPESCRAMNDPRGYGLTTGAE